MLAGLVRGLIDDQRVSESDSSVIQTEDENDEENIEGVRRIEGRPYMCSRIEQSIFAVPTWPDGAVKTVKIDGSG